MGKQLPLVHDYSHDSLLAVISILFFLVCHVENACLTVDNVGFYAHLLEIVQVFREFKHLFAFEHHDFDE